MTPRETLDEAIDRVAARISAVESAKVVWTPPVQPAWFGWRLAGGVSLLIVVIGLAIAGSLDRDDQGKEIAIDSRPLISWSAFPGLGGSKDPPLQMEETGVSTARRGGSSDPPMTDDRPAWGIPSIDRPSALAVAAVATSDIQIDDVGVGALEVAPLVIDELNRDAGPSSTKEQ